ncbi:MAG TPA: tRNA pseudouridine(55) synthase TruB [Gemmataceae bacterium]|nr:tRNA pseudouridine(55) synthase TruB [Gemmataceae bacterium]
MNGLLVIDKPGGMTSRDVVNRVQRMFPKRTKIGHTGTLDPLATGVLVVCVGAATRLADFVQAMGKTYTSRVRLGATSDTDDADGTVTERSGCAIPTREQLEDVLSRFVGEIEQVPPAYSALKVAGARAHDLARRGQSPELAARRVSVYAVRLLAYEFPFADVEIDCGKGTYIRSIARDVGEALGCGGIVQTLRRTRVGPFRAEDGVGLDDPPKLLPMALALGEMRRLTTNDEGARRFRQGQTVRLMDDAEVGTRVAVLDERGELVGIGLVVAGGVRPEVVFNTV